MTPRVSIVMPCHNGLAYLPRSIASVRAQRMQAWELIIVDDGSTNASAEWITAQEDARIRLLRQPHTGTSSARNRGLEHVKSDYVAFLDTDDTWAPTFLEKLTVALDANPQAVLAYCGWQKNRPAGSEKPAVRSARLRDTRQAESPVRTLPLANTRCTGTHGATAGNRWLSNAPAKRRGLCRLAGTGRAQSHRPRPRGPGLLPHSQPHTGQCPTCPGCPATAHRSARIP